MALFVIPRETIADDYEDGYNAGFDDGFDTAMLTEGDEEIVIDMCLEACNYLRTKKGDASNEELTNVIRKRFKVFMENRKTGVSHIFDEIMDEFSLEREGENNLL